MSNREKKRGKIVFIFCTISIYLCCLRIINLRKMEGEKKGRYLAVGIRRGFKGPRSQGVE
jgi:hypothetical protein